jgi:O-antigen/teichoic acid export membrane protein
MFSLVGLVVPNLIMLACTPILLHRLGPANYGLWTISLAAFGFMSALEFGLGTAVSKYIAEHLARGETAALSTVATIGVLAFVVVGVLLTFPLYLGAQRIAHLFHGTPTVRVVEVIHLVSFGLVPLLLLSASLAIATGLERFEVPMLVMVFQNGLTAVVAVVVVSLGGSVYDVVVSSLCVLGTTAALSTGMAAWLLARAGARPRVARGYARRLLTYVLFTGVTSAGTLLFSSVDRLAVASILGLRSVAYYTVTVGVANKLLAFADVATRPLMPASSASYGRGDVLAVKRYLDKSTAVVAAASALGGIALFAVSGPLLRAWLGNAFAAEALEPFRILVVVYAVISIAAPAFHIANGIGSAWISAVGSIVGGALTIGLIVVLGRSYGLSGVAWANAAYCLNLGLPVYVSLVVRRRLNQKQELNSDTAADTASEVVGG